MLAHILAIVRPPCFRSGLPKKSVPGANIQKSRISLQCATQKKSNAFNLPKVSSRLLHTPFFLRGIIPVSQSVCISLEIGLVVSRRADRFTGVSPHEYAMRQVSIA